jgi:hypothetical protein
MLVAGHTRGQAGPTKKNLEVLYGFSRFDRFMIVIPLLVPCLGAKARAADRVGAGDRLRDAAVVVRLRWLPRLSPDDGCRAQHDPGRRKVSVHAAVFALATLPPTLREPASTPA